MTILLPRFFYIGTRLCETRRVVKINPKGCNGIKLTESVVFQDCGIYHFFHCKKIPPISGNFYGKIYSKYFQKKSNLKHHKFRRNLQKCIYIYLHNTKTTYGLRCMASQALWVLGGCGDGVGRVVAHTHSL